ncbi:NAD(P)/FAD-dependent oxidoreductase [Actinomycetospora corticicola]|uniref:Cation diffusion facilitator CzcD-associated flavoprotein CzcO n=1 Tax=Actinomycetospora corticicola TaxID=663602 RepID=A0A7Y9DY94_9PSEU|nr:NAD(P)/FAD-dependent oxidoreductase [Actinomycetospora corticicola]NYD37595.1 cation diffusion facilitator CzcD-associated flavoprotein CzcO [Actinomycetospora corticicola]
MTVAGTTEVEVAIVGAGFAGLGLAIRMRREGRRDFVLLERADDVGGTWRDNRYPGVACDVPSHLYSFSFRPAPDWSRVYAPGAEIQQYLRTAAADEGVAEHVRFGAEMSRARWTGDRWDIRTGAGTVRARVLVLAAGRLTEPRLPAIPGLGDFEGPVVHTARWDPATRVDGRRVGVVGTGASAAQVIPQLADRARELVVFQRTPTWVVQRGDRPYTAEERAHFSRDPGAARRHREDIFDEAERGIAARRRLRPAIDELRARARAHLDAQVTDPDLRRRLAPGYEIGCKRIVLSDELYPALDRPHVTLEDSALVSVESSTAVAGSGRRHDLDVLVLATGFHSTRQPYADRVHGRTGTLAQHWSEGMSAYASTAVHGFPNMFVLDGPNASLGHNSAVYMIETQIDYVLGALAHLGAAGGPLEVSAAAEHAYVRDVDRAARDTVWLRGGCRSWYVDEASGRLTLLWPGSARSFRERNAEFDPRPYLGTAGAATA